MFCLGSFCRGQTLAVAVKPSNELPPYEVILYEPGHTHDSTHQSRVDKTPEIPRLAQEEGNASTPHNKETESGSHLEDVNQTGLDGYQLYN